MENPGVWAAIYLAVAVGFGIGEMVLPAGQYTFVWAVKMTPIQRHRYSIKAERVPASGDPVELRKRPNEQTTTGGEDVGFDDFAL